MTYAKGKSSLIAPVLHVHHLFRGRQTRVAHRILSDGEMWLSTDQRVRMFGCALAWALATAFLGTNAHAEFKVCSQGVGLYNVAIGAEIDHKFHTEGWWVLPASSCVVPIKEDLDALKLRYVYVFVQSVTGEAALDGNWDMCVDTKRFKIEKIPDDPWNCWVRGFVQAKFLEIDTGESKSWTVFVRPSKQ